MARNCLVDSKLFQTKRSGRINLRTTVQLDKELGLSAKQIARNYGRYAGCVGLQVLEQEQRRGNMQEPILMIGGRPTNNPYGAKLGERIRYIDRNIAQIGFVAMEVLQRLIVNSPIGPMKDESRWPHYWRAHILLVNGREWTPQDPMLKPTDTVQIVNTNIYAKRLELGWSMQAPTGIYKPTYRWARRMFGDSFTIRWGFRPLANVRQGQVRRYDFPKVQPGTVTAMFRPNPNRGLGVGTYAKSGTFNFVTRHGAAATKFGFKNVTAVFPFIELKPKDIAVGVAKAGQRPATRSFRI